MPLTETVPPVRDRSIEARRAARAAKAGRERLIVDCLNRGLSMAEIAARIASRKSAFAPSCRDFSPAAGRPRRRTSSRSRSAVSTTRFSWPTAPCREKTCGRSAWLSGSCASSTATTASSPPHAGTAAPRRRPRRQKVSRPSPQPRRSPRPRPRRRGPCAECARASLRGASIRSDRAPAIAPHKPENAQWAGPGWDGPGRVPRRSPCRSAAGRRYAREWAKAVASN